MRERSKVTRCKIKGCKGGPHKSNGVFNKGFCDRHYGQYRTKKIDLAGKPIKSDDTEKNGLRRFNILMRRAASVDKDVRVLDARLEDEGKAKGTLIRQSQNKSVPKLVHDMRHLGEHIREREFIFGNIDNLHNVTLQSILQSREPVPAFDTGIPGVYAYEVVQIVKLLRRGYAISDVKRLYPTISRVKLRIVHDNYEDGKYPIPEQR